MGLFEKKPPCAICGGKVSMFPWKVDGQMICDTCHGDVDLSEEVMKHITLEEFKQYMVFREENALLKQKFNITRKVDFGWLDEKILFDADNRLMCMDKKLRKPVFEGRQVKSFEIREDQELLFSGTPQELIRYTSTVPARVRDMAPQIEQLRMQAQMRLEMERMLEQKQKEDKENYHSYSLPPVPMPVPFHKFYVEIHFDHPYWPLFKAERKAPEFDQDNPSVEDYLDRYQKSVLFLEDLVGALMEVAFPGVPERTVAAASAPAAGNGPVPASGGAMDAVQELRRLKELMDKGILTEEEFTAKKRKLLGI